MKKNYVIGLLILFYFQFLSCSENESKKSGNWDKGKISNEGAIIIEHDGIEREYIIYIPETYDGSSSVPLVLNFHGGGGTATGQMLMSDMRLISDTANFIIVYPQGSLLEDGGGSHWNSMIESVGNKSTADDIGFIQILINDLLFRYNIDSNKIYACGYSNGADFSLSLACYLSHHIAAIAPVSGLMMSEADSLCNPTHKTGVLVFNGTSDSSRPYNGIDNWYLPVDSAITYWVQYNNADSIVLNNLVNSEGLSIEHFSYYNDVNTKIVELYKVLNGGHDWFNINYKGNDDNIDQLIWDFFSHHSITD